MGLKLIQVHELDIFLKSESSGTQLGATESHGIFVKNLPPCTMYIGL